MRPKRLYREQQDSRLNRKRLRNGDVKKKKDGWTDMTRCEEGREGEEERGRAERAHKHPPSSQAHGTIHHSPSASRGAAAPIPTAPKIK